MRVFYYRQITWHNFHWQMCESTNCARKISAIAEMLHYHSAFFCFFLIIHFAVVFGYTKVQNNQFIADVKKKPYFYCLVSLKETQSFVFLTHL